MAVLCIMVNSPMYPLFDVAKIVKLPKIYLCSYAYYFSYCTSSVLAEDAIKAALSDYKVKQENRKAQASSANN